MAFISTALVLALALQSAPAATGQGQAANAKVETASAEQAPEDKVICRKIGSAGTRFKERVCAKASFWEKQKRRDIEITREFQQNDGSTKGG